MDRYSCVPPSFPNTQQPSHSSPDTFWCDNIPLVYILKNKNLRNLSESLENDISNKDILQMITIVFHFFSELQVRKYPEFPLVLNEEMAFYMRRLYVNDARNTVT